MMSTTEIFERARLSRDARFDGRFFVGVRTTGIYCRPICPANAPKSENVTFYRTAAAAGEAGFRPCLRCRPECAPGTPAWAGTSTTVQRGLRLIAEGALDDGNLENLADRLGVTSRHLRRLFSKHLGASPLAVAHTQRLHFAKNLIDQTALSMQDISVASGFGSVRRFNDTFRKTYGRTPRELRRHRDASVLTSAFSVQLPYREPFDWNRLLGFFAARATPGIETVQDGRYLRSIAIDDARGIVDVRDSGGHLSLSLHGIDTSSLFSIVQRVRSMFDLDASTEDIARVLAGDRILKELLKKNSGVRVPGCWDGFELTVRAILGQQISVSAATTLAGRIADRYGEKIEVAVDDLQQAPDRLFPGPQKLVRARLETLGIIGSRARTIRSLAKAVLDGAVSFDTAQAPDSFCESLTAIKGIGDWTAEYVAMRTLKNPDAFPASDLGLLRAFDKAGRERMKPGELAKRAEAWRPWRAYAALLLWGSAKGTGGSTMYYCYLHTPIGELLLAGENNTLSMIGFPKGKMRRDPEPDWIYNEQPLEKARQQLEEYFAGTRKDFDLPVVLNGTEFQLNVLQALQKIPYGETVSYGEIARRIGRPKAVRAVGAANGRNPIPIVVPCHRVIGSSGDLTGFGGGLDTKEALLRLEAENSEHLL